MFSCVSTSHGLTAYKNAPYEDNFTKTFTMLEGVQLYNYFFMRVSGVPLFIGIKYTRLKPTNLD